MGCNLKDTCDAIANHPASIAFEKELEAHRAANGVDTDSDDVISPAPHTEYQDSHTHNVCTSCTANPHALNTSYLMRRIVNAYMYLVQGKRDNALAELYRAIELDAHARK